MNEETNKSKLVAPLVVFVSIIVIAVLIVVLYYPRPSSTTRLEQEPCEAYGNNSIDFVPVRCYQYFHVRSGE